MSTLDPITIGTECSGIEAPIVALRRMGVRHKHLYSTECNESAKVWSAYNFSPLQCHEDMLTRDAAKLPCVDIYVCGIPCQDFSIMNQRRGKVRCEEVVDAVLDAIMTSLPKSFVIENVPSFWKHETGRRMQACLQEKYDIFTSVLSPHEFGCPQSRKRLYVVGVKMGLAQTKFEWPSPVKLEKKCTDILTNDLSTQELESCRVRDKYYSKKLEEWKFETETRRIVSLSSYALTMHRKRATNDTTVSPCLLASHPGLYVPHLDRLLHPVEMLALQGFTGCIRPPSLSNSVIRRLVGNAMSVDVLMHVFFSLLRCLGRQFDCAFAPLR
jgi:DNA-cytosine methyltransferase